MHNQAIPTRTITRLVRAKVIAAAIALFAIFAAVQVASAHGGFEHVRGTVTKVSADSITVKTTDGKMVDVALNEKTTYARGTAAVKVDDIKVGDRIVIDATKHDNKFVAAEVKLGAAATTASAHEHDDHAEHADHHK